MSSLDNLGSISSLMTDSGKSNSIDSIPLSQIKVDPDQPRKLFDETELRELANSIEKNGLLQPINVREDGDGYIINCGERRFQACFLLEKSEILAVVNNNFQKIGQLVENVARVDLGLLERSYFIAQLIEQGLTQKEISEQLGHKNTTWVSRHITVSKAPPSIIQAINAGQIESLEVAQTLTSKSKKDSRWKRLIEEFLQDLADDEKVTTTMLRSFINQATQFLEKDDNKEESSTDSDLSNENKKNDFSFKEKFEKLVSLDNAILANLNRVATDENVISAIEDMTPKVRKAFFSLLLELNDDFDTEQWQKSWNQFSSEMQY